MEKMSATGLLPWYAGRRMGLEGRGVRSVYLYAWDWYWWADFWLRDLRNGRVTLQTVEQDIETRADMQLYSSRVSWYS